MKYNIEKINEISQLLAEVVEEAIKMEVQAGVLIGDVEMAMRESLRCGISPARANPLGT